MASSPWRLSPLFDYTQTIITFKLVKLTDPPHPPHLDVAAYHIGNGWFGGFLPPIAFAIVAATGNIYDGLR